MIFWDRGFYRHPSSGDESESEKLLLDGLKKGDLKFVLAGEKLHCEFTLVKTGKDGKSWLLLKKKDRHAAKVDIFKEIRSVVSHKSVEEMLENSFGKSFRQRKMSQIRLHEAKESKELKNASVIPMPHNIKPMLATPVREPFDDTDLLFEVKWDGYRAVAEVRDGQVSLYSRNLIALDRKFFPLWICCAN